MLSINDALDELSRSGKRFPPLSMQLSRSPGNQPAVLRAAWEDHCFEFDIEYRPYATPKLIRRAIADARARAQSSGHFPMVLAPYLSERQLLELEREGVSGLDLSGNGIVSVPGTLLVYRSGAPNRFPASAKIRNVYRGTSSLVGRVLLLCRSTDTVSQLVDEVRRRGGQISLPTVSKVLSALDQQLIVDRSAGIRLLQADKLLEGLRGEYRPPESSRRVALKIATGLDVFVSHLQQLSEARESSFVATGASSAPRYATIARGDIPAFYCADVKSVLDLPGVSPVQRFADVELIETRDPTVYFDSRTEDGFPWASPIQTYLELTAGDKRDQETAEQVREQLLGAAQ